MKAACKEDNNLNYQEIKCVNVSQIITVTNYQTLQFDYLRFTKCDFTTVWFWTYDCCNNTPFNIAISVVSRTSSLLQNEGCILDKPF